MRKPKIRELGEAIRALIKGPYTSRFPKDEAKISPNFRGKPEFDESKCTGCTACTFVCPTAALTFKDKLSKNENKRIITINLGKCIFCGQCELNCITGEGIHLTTKFDLATTDSSTLINDIKKELVLCELCNSVIAPTDQIKWIFEKVGSAAFSNPTLFLSYLKDYTRVDDKKLTRNEPNRQRHSRIRILCPNCRRETTAEIYYS